jgi:alkylated DNA repair protein (DNA oxidative demethylase)
MVAVSDPPPGFLYMPDFVTVAEHDATVAFLETIDYDEVRMHGVAARRTVKHYGVDYAYDSREVRPTEPLPSELEWLRLRSAELGGVEAERFVEVLISRYPEGATIGWHRDAPMFGSTVVGVSLGSACRLRFRRGSTGNWQTYEVTAEPRSAYVLSGAARWAWQHSIPATPALRYSITFRTLRRE